MTATEEPEDLGDETRLRAVDARGSSRLAQVLAREAGRDDVDPRQANAARGRRRRSARRRSVREHGPGGIPRLAQQLGVEVPAQRARARSHRSRRTARRRRQTSAESPRHEITRSGFVRAGLAPSTVGSNRCSLIRRTIRRGWDTVNVRCSGRNLSNRSARRSRSGRAARLLRAPRSDLTVDALKGVAEGRARPPRLERRHGCGPRSRADAHDRRVERSVMDLAHRDAVRHDRLSTFGVTFHVRRVEQLRCAEVAHSALAARRPRALALGRAAGAPAPHHALVVLGAATAARRRRAVPARRAVTYRARRRTGARRLRRRPARPGRSGR